MWFFYGSSDRYIYTINRRNTLESLIMWPWKEREIERSLLLALCWVLIKSWDSLLPYNSSFIYITTAPLYFFLPALVLTSQSRQFGGDKSHYFSSPGWPLWLLSDGESKWRQDGDGDPAQSPPNPPNPPGTSMHLHHCHYHHYHHQEMHEGVIMDYNRTKHDKRPRKQLLYRTNLTKL